MQVTSLALAFQKPEFLMEIMSREKNTMGQKLKLEGWSRAQTEDKHTWGGTESAGAIPMGRAGPH